MSSSSSTFSAVLPLAPHRTIPVPSPVPSPVPFLCQQLLPGALSPVGTFNGHLRLSSRVLCDPSHRTSSLFNCASSCSGVSLLWALIMLTSLCSVTYCTVLYCTLCTISQDVFPVSLRQLLLGGLSPVGAHVLTSKLETLTQDHLRDLVRHWTSAHQGRPLDGAPAVHQRLAKGGEGGARAGRGEEGPGVGSGMPEHGAEGEQEFYEIVYGVVGAPERVLNVLVQGREDFSRQVSELKV